MSTENLEIHEIAMFDYSFQLVIRDNMATLQPITGTSKYPFDFEKIRLYLVDEGFITNNTALFLI